MKDTKQELPICKNTGKNLFQFFDDHRGGDVILARNLALKRFPITESEYDMWLGEWRFKGEGAMG